MNLYSPSETLEPALWVVRLTVQITESISKL